MKKQSYKQKFKREHNNILKHTQHTHSGNKAVLNNSRERAINCKSVSMNGKKDIYLIQKQQITVCKYNSTCVYFYRYQI